MGFSNDRRSRDERDPLFQKGNGEGAGRSGRAEDNDPLAELARMIGRDDPFAVFDEPERREPSMDEQAHSQPAAPRHRDDYQHHDEADLHGYSRYEPLFDTPPAHHRHEGAYEDAGRSNADHGLRGSLAAPAHEHWQEPQAAEESERHETDFDFDLGGGYGAEAEAPIEDGRSHHAHHAHDAHPQDGHWQGHEAHDGHGPVDNAEDADRYAEPYMGLDSDVSHQPPDADERGAGRAAAGPLAALRGASRVEVRRGGMVLVGAVAAFALLGGGATLAYRTLFDTSYQSGPPPVIQANVEPTKFAPDDPGGTDVPHQNKLIYDRVAGPGQDVDNVTLAPDDEAAGADAASGMAGDMGDVIEPRRVRTVVVRPDGTIVQGAPGSAAQTANSGRVAAVPGETDATLREPALPDTSAADLLSDDALGAMSAPAAEDDTGAETLGADGMPLPQRRPGEDDDETSSLDAVPSTNSAAASQADAAMPVTLAAATAGAPAGEGGWGVQLASQRSEDQARSAYSSLQQRYAGVLGEREARYVRADLGERGVFYRVHVPAGSRDEASSLCTELKSAGGDCLVQRN